MPQSRFRRSIVVVAAVLLVLLALVYCGIAAILISMLTQPRHSIVRLGEFRLYSEFGVAGALSFGVLCLLSLFAGLAALRRWSGWALIGRVAGVATMVLGFYGVWMFLRMMMPDLPYFPIPLGVNLPVEIALAAGAVGLFVVLAMPNPAENSS